MQLIYPVIWYALASMIAANAPTGREWAERSIYQIMTDRFARPEGATDVPCDPYKYCGGSWTGIIENLDYIEELGFTAIQISPVVENIHGDTKYGEAYHGYWPTNIHSLNDRFGTAEDLRNLANKLHERDMYLMVDVVINDMAQAVNGSMLDEPAPEIDWSQLVPFNDEKYYHSFCEITDWDDPEIYQKCWFAAEGVVLPDLKTEDETVASAIQEWIQELVGNYSIDGLRIDAAKHMNDDYLGNFTQAAGVFTMGEAYATNTSLVCGYQELVSGVLNYPLHAPIIQAFTAGDMPGLADEVRSVRDECEDITRLGTFVENHDIPRFASLVNDTTLAKNAMAFNILSDGIPIVYQGQEQHMTGNYSPFNREALWNTGYKKDGSLFNLTAILNRLRNHAIEIDNHYVTSRSEELYLDGSTYATRKGTEGAQVVSVFSNQGSDGGRYQLALNGGFAPGTEVIEILDCTTMVANNAGNITVDMDAGEPRVFFPIQSMKNSGLCGFRHEKKSTQNSSSGSKNRGDPNKKASSTGHRESVPVLPVVLCAFAAVRWIL